MLTMREKWRDMYTLYTSLYRDYPYVFDNEGYLCLEYIDRFKKFRSTSSIYPNLTIPEEAVRFADMHGVGVGRLEMDNSVLYKYDIMAKIGVYDVKVNHKTMREDRVCARTLIFPAPLTNHGWNTVVPRTDGKSYAWSEENMLSGAFADAVRYLESVSNGNSVSRKMVCRLYESEGEPIFNYFGGHFNNELTKLVIQSLEKTFAVPVNQVWFLLNTQQPCEHFVYRQGMRGSINITVY